MKALLFRLWPVLFIAFMWSLFSYPYFLQSKVPYASMYQTNFFAPWSHYEQFDGPIKNGAMPDVHSQIYPWKKFTIDTFRKGDVPFWNPHSFAGTPHLANFQSAVLTPFNILFFVFPFIDAWSILVLLQPILAGLFMYLFMQSLKVSRLGSLIASVTFMFCGFLVVWMAYGTLAYAILYLPLALFAIERYDQTQKKRFLALLTLTIPLSFFSGHFQISFYFFMTVVTYALFKGISARNLSSIVYYLLFTFIGLVLSMPQLLPSIELYKEAVRSELFQISEAIPIQYLITIIAPDFFGNPVTRNDWFGHYAEWAGFIGVLPFLFAMYIVIRRRSSLSWFFFLLGIFSLILAVRSPLSEAIVALKIPVISTSALSRVIVLFSFAFAVLSGMGLDQLKSDLENRKTFKGLLLALSTMSIVFVAAWLILLTTKLMDPPWVIVGKHNLILPTIVFVGFSFSLLLAAKYKNTALLILLLLLFVTSFDSFRFAQKWMPFDPKQFVYPNVPVVDMIKKYIGEGRIFGNLGGEATTYYGFSSIEGYDPLYIRRYGEFIQSGASGNFLGPQRSVVMLPRDAVYADRVLDLLGVTLIFHPIADTNQGWAYPVWRDLKRYTVVYQDDKFQLYRNTMALPRAMLYYDFEVVKNDRDIIKRFYSEDFDFRKILLLEENPGIEPRKNGRGEAKIILYTPNSITIEVKSGSPSILFLADNFYPGWKVKVNNNEEKMYRANYTFRAVAVPTGLSIVVFEYNAHFF